MVAFKVGVVGCTKWQFADYFLMQFDQKLARTGPQLELETLAKQRMKKGTPACKPESSPQISCDVSQLQI